MDYLKSAYGVAEQRACRLVAISRSVYQYRSHRDAQSALRQRMCEIAATRVRYGYRKYVCCCYGRAIRSARTGCTVCIVRKGCRCATDQIASDVHR
ncbi:putative transposase [Burkholderia pseudomallei]|nr:putative transposase [Burkholderia pseudomallei]